MPHAHCVAHAAAPVREREGGRGGEGGREGGREGHTNVECIHCTCIYMYMLKLCIFPADES